VSNLPAGHVLQSFEWGEFKSRQGWEPFRLLFSRGGEPVAAASVLLRRLSWGPWGVMYVPKGPALDYSDPGMVTAVLSQLEGLARTRSAIFIKIDPDVPADSSGVTRMLEGRRWRASAEQIQFRNTMLIDLRQSEEELLSAMKAKWRYNVRLAQRKGVEVCQGGFDDLPLFYGMYTATSARDQFIIRPFSYYADAWGTFLTSGLAQLLLARYEGELLAGLMLFHFADRACTCTGPQATGTGISCPTISCNGRPYAGPRPEATASMICGARLRCRMRKIPCGGCIASRRALEGSFARIWGLTISRSPGRSTGCIRR